MDACCARSKKTRGMGPFEPREPFIRRQALSPDVSLWTPRTEEAALEMVHGGRFAKTHLL
jgi:hypothetical protein